ncbi:MAG TPA: ATP-binding protein [Candidatus Synoicihabitans sp.]|nr:ATP-binding protein [Candidatus Synoicihabitans sp.]
MPEPKPRLTHDQHLFVTALAAGAPAVLFSMWHLWISGDQEPKVQWTFTLIILGCWFGFAAALRERVIRPLHTMANLLSALREGDFSIRARGARRDDALGDVMAEINSLGVILQEQRLGAMEATALLRTVMEEIDVAIFAFDSGSVLRLVNRAGQELLATPAEKILGRTAEDIGLAEALSGEPQRVLTTTDFPGANGRWGMRRTQFREGGLPHHLLVIADLSEALRAEELKAWQRLVRVLGHELNNSLAPIKSIAGSLTTLLKRPTRAPDWEQDMFSGLDIIASRAEGLSRFMQAYSRLARLPQPVLVPCDLRALIHRVVGLELRMPVQVIEGPPVTLPCDCAQIEQVLINLVKNAVEAALETAGGVRLRWQERDGEVAIEIEDDGPGIAQATNLFVPFFTTKPEGSGIGLVLCRQIAENHRGELRLQNRREASGCVATLTLPT